MSGFSKLVFADGFPGACGCRACACSAGEAGLVSCIRSKLGSLALQFHQPVAAFALEMDQVFIARDHVQGAPAAPVFELLDNPLVAVWPCPIHINAEPSRDFLGQDGRQHRHFHDGVLPLGLRGGIPNANNHIPTIQQPVQSGKSLMEFVSVLLPRLDGSEGIAKHQVEILDRLRRAIHRMFKRFLKQACGGRPGRLGKFLPPSADTSCKPAEFLDQVPRRGGFLFIGQAKAIESPR